MEKENIDPPPPVISGGEARRMISSGLQQVNQNFQIRPLSCKAGGPTSKLHCSSLCRKSRSLYKLPMQKRNSFCSLWIPGQYWGFLSVPFLLLAHVWKQHKNIFFFFSLFSLPFRIEFKVFKWAADPSEVSPKQVFFRAFVAKLQLDFFWYQFYDFQNDQSIRNFLQKMISVVGIPEVISSEFSLEGSANILCKASIVRSSKPVYCKSPVIILTAWGTWGTFHINGASFCYIHVGNRKSFTFVNGWDTGKSVFHQAEGHGALGHN